MLVDFLTVDEKGDDSLTDFALNAFSSGIVAENAVDLNRDELSEELFGIEASTEVVQS